MSIDQVREAIQRFYGDTSRSRAETKEALEELVTDIEAMIDTLDDDDEL